MKTDDNEAPNSPATGVAITGRTPTAPQPMICVSASVRRVRKSWRMMHAWAGLVTA